MAHRKWRKVQMAHIKWRTVKMAQIKIGPLRNSPNKIYAFVHSSARKQIFASIDIDIHASGLCIDVLFFNE